ncbi:hypothetical protein [Pseudodesulfovibrio sp.]|uniref:hypothetical protein n=1 Tax=Pseudodesulfovibrio sp. TaxID=2035812 RepID=UPI0026169768|nr:hypothetical protein [Pseudodesulfovibrio sp.]MDD3311295.1 hypothetical protein [Pseudodesulfovibrio sp.]
MQRKSPRTLVAGVLLAAALLAAGCSQAPSDAEKRLAALEAEVKALRDEARTREKAMREEMAMVRTNLASIRTILELDRGRAAAPDKPGDTPKPDTASPDASGPSDELDRELDAKAKGFVKENLDRLLVITRKLLDKMERELDKQEETAPPKPKGDEI